MGFADELKNKASELIEDVREKFNGDAKEPDSRPEPEPVEDFAAAGPVPPEQTDEYDERVQEETEELKRHSPPGL
jgi:hypothetical protein